tara:strand:- start:488 stop:706 length:219 start_codon:yes stop_codon:yes gene_type:complete
MRDLYLGVEMVSRCCGTHWVDSIDHELGIDAPEDYVCNSCQDFCDIVEEYEYRQWRLDERAEAEADDRKLGL